LDIIVKVEHEKTPLRNNRYVCFKYFSLNTKLIGPQIFHKKGVGGNS